MAYKSIYSGRPFIVGSEEAIPSYKTFSGVPVPEISEGSLYSAVSALKENAEILTRAYGNVLDSAVLVRDLEALGLTVVDPTGRIFKKYPEHFQAAHLYSSLSANDELHKLVIPAASVKANSSDAWAGDRYVTPIDGIYSITGFLNIAPDATPAGDTFLFRFDLHINDVSIFASPPQLTGLDTEEFYFPLSLTTVLRKNNNVKMYVYLDHQGAVATVDMDLFLSITETR